MGRPSNLGSASERAKRRREMVRVNVQRHRHRKNEEKRLLAQRTGHGNALTEQYVEESSRTSSALNSSDASGNTCQQVRVNLVMDDKDISWYLQLPFRLNLSPEYRDVFIAAWNKHCQMPDHRTSRSTPAHVNVCCGSWVNSACISSSAAGNDLLADVLLASALILLGKTSDNSAMVQYAMELQSKVLATLRQRLCEKEREREQQRKHGAIKLQQLTTIILTIAVADLLVKKSWQAFNIHLKGIGALIRLAGPKSINTQAAADQFFAYRAVQVPFAFTEREHSFLSQTEWIAFPGRRNYTVEAQCLHSLIDVIYSIPSLMHAFDSAADFCHPTSDILYMLEQLNSIDIEMTVWERKSRIIFPWTSIDLESSFDCIEFDTTGTMKFSDTLTANTASFLLGAKVALFDLAVAIRARTESDVDGLEEKRSIAMEAAIQKSRLWAARAIRCINTFRVLEPQTMGKLVCLFPLDMAWRSYLNLSQSQGVECDKEISHCEQLAEEYELTGLPALKKH